MSKKSGIFYIVLIFGVLAFLGLFPFLAQEKTYSENENRYLDTIPKLTKDEVLSGKFQKKFESAFSNQFAFRDRFMEISTETKKILGLKEAGGAYFGKNNYYFAKTRNQEIDQKQYLKNLRFVEYLGSRNKDKTSLILVPSPAVVLKDKLPSCAPYYDAKAMYKEEASILKETKDVDVYTQLSEYGKQENTGKNQIYFKTDHHWTLLGAYAAYEAYCIQTKQNVHTYGYFSAKKVSDSFYGTMYSKVLDPFAKPDDLYAAVNVPQAEVICDGEAKKGIYDVEMLLKKDKYAYFFGGNYAKTEIKSHSSGSGKMLVIKDSFANSFVPFLMEDYNDITMIDLRYYRSSVNKLISEKNFDRILILYEMSNFANDINLYKLVH